MQTMDFVLHVPQIANLSLRLLQLLPASVQLAIAGQQGGRALRAVWDFIRATLTISASNAQITHKQYQQRRRVYQNVKALQVLRTQK